MNSLKEQALKYLDCEINSDNISDCLAFMEEHQVNIKSPEGTIDICGTGGTGFNLLNISTTTAIVVAACGYPVAKHCGGGVTSKCGSSDVLRELGVNMDITPKQAEKQLADLGLVFLNAKTFNPVFDLIAEERKSKGFSIYNVMGALLSPANVDYKFIEILTEHTAIAKYIRREVVPRSIFCEFYDYDGYDDSLNGRCVSYNANWIKCLLDSEAPIPEDDSIKFASFDSIVEADACSVIAKITTLDAKNINRKVSDAIDGGKALELLNKVIKYGKKCNG